MMKAYRKKLMKKHVEKQIILASAVTLSCVALLVICRLMNRMRFTVDELDNDYSGDAHEDTGIIWSSARTEAAESNTAAEHAAAAGAVTGDSAVPEAAEQKLNTTDIGALDDGSIPEEPELPDNMSSSHDT
jgi:hypothetical protein